MFVQTTAELYEQLLNWHLSKHAVPIDNTPSTASAEYLNKLVLDILLPVTNQFGMLTITYGFTGPELSRYIKRISPAGTAPSIDQHACTELNSKGTTISNRPGAACDFSVKGHESSMNEIVLFICENLVFDKLYYYGKSRPIHISVADNPLCHLQVMQQSIKGRRFPGKKAYGEQAITLAKEL